jgi:hypothetical protein
MSKSRRVDSLVIEIGSSDVYVFFIIIDMEIIMLFYSDQNFHFSVCAGC